MLAVMDILLQRDHVDGETPRRGRACIAGEHSITELRARIPPPTTFEMLSFSRDAQESS
jgi:hypothetical protein